VLGAASMPKNLRHRVWAAAYDDDRVVGHWFVTQAISLLDAVKVLRHRASVSRSTDNLALSGSGPDAGILYYLHRQKPRPGMVPPAGSLLSAPLWRSEEKIVGWPSVESGWPRHSAPGGQPVTTHILTARRKHRDARKAVPAAEQSHVVGRHCTEGRSERAPRSLSIRPALN
jgi:hypothetical protein